MRHMLSYILIVLWIYSCDPPTGGDNGDPVDCMSFLEQMDCLNAGCTWFMAAEGDYCFDEGNITTGGEEEIPVVEDYFSYNISSQVSYYWFEKVLINYDEIDTSDWVGAFKGDVCVGSQKWICSGNCSLPVYGENSLNDLTEGYMLPGEVPSFKIYDASEHMYYNAIPRQDFEWQDGNIDNTFQADTLSSSSSGSRGGW